MHKLRNIFTTYSDELTLRVEWPTMEQLQAHTVTVLTASLILALSVAVVDLIANQSFSLVYSLFN